jgi:hypothetical protein
MRCATPRQSTAIPKDGQMAILLHGRLTISGSRQARKPDLHGKGGQMATVLHGRLTVSEVKVKGTR